MKKFLVNGIGVEDFSSKFIRSRSWSTKIITSQSRLCRPQILCGHYFKSTSRIRSRNQSNKIIRNRCLSRSGTVWLRTVSFSVKLFAWEKLYSRGQCTVQRFVLQRKQKKNRKKIK